LLQQAFVDEQTAQWGYCSNGMVMSAKALFDRNPHPSEEQVLRVTKVAKLLHRSPRPKELLEPCLAGAE
jgi:aerobic-type carbon monoxide dehydrogenase small subunit (CoxS/CutS family)